MSDPRFGRGMAVVAATLLLGACSASGDAPRTQASGPPAAPVQNAEPATAPAATATAIAAAVPNPPAAGLRVFIDPVTGKPRDPTAAEIKALQAAGQAAGNKETVAPQADREIVLPDGTVAIQGHAMSEMKACVQKDGHVVVDHDCRSDPAAKP